MILKEIGPYIDPQSGKVYVVIKRINETTSRYLSGATQTFESSCDYITACGIGLNPKDENENCFELIKKDGVIVKQNS